MFIISPTFHFIRARIFWEQWPLIHIITDVFFFLILCIYYGFTITAITESSWPWFEYLNMLPRTLQKFFFLYKVKMQTWFIVKLMRLLIVWHILVDILNKWHAFPKVNLPVVVHYGTIVKVYTCYIDLMNLWLISVFNLQYLVESMALNCICKAWIAQSMCLLS